MFKLFRKYRHFLSLGFLVFYLGGGFQYSLFECFHFMTHLGDMVNGTYHVHHFHSHTSQHDHAVLNIMDQVADALPDHADPASDSQEVPVKKYPQISVNNQPEPDGRADSPQTLFLYKNLFSLEFLRIPSPPPKV